MHNFKELKVWQKSVDFQKRHSEAWRGTVQGKPWESRIKKIASPFSPHLPNHKRVRNDVNDTTSLIPLKLAWVKALNWKRKWK